MGWSLTHTSMAMTPEQPEPGEEKLTCHLQEHMLQGACASHHPKPQSDKACKAA